MSAVRRIALLLALAVLASLCLAGPAGAAKPRQGPAGLAFYDPPEQLPSKGRLIWTRPASSLIALDNAASTRLVLYSSTTPQGKRTAVSGSVSIPEGTPPPGGWPVITFGHATTGAADVCAPSRDVGVNPAGLFVTYIDPILESWLAAGYALVRTDYQGLGTPGPHSYLVGQAEGRAMVDILPAARRIDSRIGKRYLIAGHSQGGQSALFAAGVAANRQPGFALRGTVAMAPANHVLAGAKQFESVTEPNALSGDAALILLGASTESRALRPPNRLFGPATLPLYPQLNQTCVPQLQGPDSFGGIAPSELLAPNVDRRVFNRVLGQMNPAVRTSRPIFLAQGLADTTVLPQYTARLERELTGLGDRVDYATYPDVSHLEIPFASGSDVLSFFQSRLAAG